MAVMMLVMMVALIAFGDHHVSGPSSHSGQPVTRAEEWSERNTAAPDISNGRSR